MANRMWRPVQTSRHGRTLVCGSFGPNGGSAVQASSVKGEGFTVARTSAGLFTLTFLDSFADLIAADSHLQLAAGDDKFTQVGTYTPATATTPATLTIRVWDISGAAETDVAANANNRVHFQLIFDNAPRVL